MCISGVLHLCWETCHLRCLGYDLVLPFHSTAWSDYWGQSELLPKCHAINSTISALSRTDTWCAAVEQSKSDVLETAPWKTVVNPGSIGSIPLWPPEENCLLFCLSTPFPHDEKKLESKTYSNDREIVQQIPVLPIAVPSGISLIKSNQVISKRPLRQFQSLQLIARKMTHHVVMFPSWSVKNLKLQKFPLEDQLVPPSKNLLASQSVGGDHVPLLQVCKCYQCKGTLTGLWQCLLCKAQGRL